MADEPWEMSGMRWSMDLNRFVVIPEAMPDFDLACGDPDWMTDAMRELELLWSGIDEEPDG